MKKKIKALIDIAMMVLLTYLANRTNGMGLLAHAICGIALFALFVAHHLLNLKWHKNVLRGKYSASRAVFAATNAALLVLALLMAASSFMISGLVFSGPFFPVKFAWRNVHALCSSWIFMLSAFHFALHMKGLSAKLREKLGAPAVLAMHIAFALAGAFCFSQSRIFSNLFLLYTSASLRWSNAAQFLFSAGIVLGVIALSQIAFSCKRKA